MARSSAEPAKEEAGTACFRTLGISSALADLIQTHEMNRIGCNKLKTVEGVMIRLVTRGCFTESYAKRLVSAPEDREPAVRNLIEGAGGKLISFYFTTGDSDFMVISEADESESIIAAM